ncbi:MAG: response regulator transcription factor [Lachnospiraceae bacterium]|nr:response regulator transcription factor [Lachnospiraceae bacterium]
MYTILLVENDRDCAREIGDFLKLHGLEHYLETDASAALALLSHKRYDAVILNGDAVAADIRRYLSKLREYCDAPLFFLSAGAAEEDAIRALDAGADDYIRKPLRPGELSARILAALRARERYLRDSDEERAVIEMRGIRLDPIRRRVWVRRREKSFTRREYELLLYFMEHPDQPFTREALYRAVWKDEAVGGLATVTVHIRKLRAKLEERPGEPELISTAWGVGYVFRSEGA